MTRAEEIFNELMEEQEYGSGIFKATRTQFSVQKLATYLATLESSKDEDKDEDLTFEAPLTAQMVDEVLKIYPFKDEKNRTLAETAIGRLNNWNMGEHRHTPPSEEKKCEETFEAANLKGRCKLLEGHEGIHQPELVSPTQEEKKCERHPNQKLCPSCNKHFCKHTRTDSPTPPDAWEEEILRAQMPSKTTKSGWEVSYDPTYLIDWLRSKKKEWEQASHKRGREEATKGWGHQKREWRRKGRQEARTTTLDEVERLVQSAMNESHNEGTYKYDWLYEDILEKIEELRKV